MWGTSFPAGDWCSPSSLKENAMFVASLTSNARPIGVLLGGSGICQTVTPLKPDVCALLMPRKPCADQDTSGSVSVASVDSLWEVDHHD